MNEIPSNIESKEGQEKAKIVLHFFRHDEKENGRSKSDTEIRLTEAGKFHAKSLASEETDLSQSVAFGSPRKRTQETAALQMAGVSADLTGIESLEELKEKLDKDLGYGTKVHYDDRLDFTLPPPGPYLDEMVSAFKANKLLKYIVEESDGRAEELGLEDTVLTCSTQASKIAQIIQKYFRILPRWQNLIEDKEKAYKPIMERFLGSHQSTSESFLAKLIEKVKGREESDKFVSALDGKGFDFSEGFKAEVMNNEAQEEVVRITFKKEKDGNVVFEFDEVISREIIESLILK